MDTSSLIKIVVPKLPVLFQTAASHTLGWSKTSSKWELRTELTVTFLRSLVNSDKPSSISQQQKSSLRDPGIKGPLWVSKVTLPKPPEDDVRDVLVGAIESYQQEALVYDVPALVPVEAEWTGARPGVGKNAPRPPLADESAHYAKLMAEVTSEATVLYLHGGALYLCDPSTHRLVCSRLAKKTGGRCLSVRYRLAPQHPFPAALLDCLIAYLSLLSPPPGAAHAPVPTENIVVCGDSAGGTLALALVQLIARLHALASPPGSTPTVRFHGRDVPLRMPAGAALNSAWADLTRCMPSWRANQPWDYLPAPQPGSATAHFPQCALWPTEPPRGDLYCDVAMLRHPLVSPLAAKEWAGACPLWFVYGTECLTDEGKAMAARAAGQGVPVEWHEYEAMPHVFAAVLEKVEASGNCFEEWAGFVTRVVGDGRVETKGIFHRAKSLEETAVDVRTLSEFSDEEVMRKMDEAAKRRGEGHEMDERFMAKL